MQPFMEAGLDSLGATELQASLGAAFGMDLPATATIDHPTSAALAAYITSLLSGLHAPAGNHIFIFLRCSRSHWWLHTYVRIGISACLPGLRPALPMCTHSSHSSRASGIFGMLC